MKKIKNQALKTILLCLVISIILACIGIGLCACDDGQNQDADSTNPPIGEDDDNNNQPPQEEEKYVSIDSLWNEFFNETSFDDDLQAAYNVICKKALPDLDVEIKEIDYNSSTDIISLTVSYYEYDSIRTGTIKFNAPNILNQLEDSGTKSVILNVAEYLTTSQIKANETENAKTKIANAIEEVRTTIEEEFTSLKKDDLSVEKEEIKFITYGEIYDEYYSNLGFDEDINTNLQLRISFFQHSNPILMLYHINVNDQTITYRVDSTESGSYSGFNQNPSQIAYSRRSWLNIISNVPQIILNATINAKSLVFDYIGLSEQTKLPINKKNVIKSNIDSAIENIKTSIFNAFISIESKEIRQVQEDNSIFGSAMDQIKEMEVAHKLLPDKEILCCYVETPWNGRTFDDAGRKTEYTQSGPSRRFFIPTSGYITGFNVDILYKEDDDIMRYHARITVPHYTDISYTEYWDSFLKGITTKTGSVTTSTNTRYRYKVSSESTVFECKIEDWIGAVEHSEEIIEEDCSYVIRNGKAYLLSIKNSQIDTYIVPSKLGNKEVAGWGSWTFCNSTITNIELPDTIKILMAGPKSPPNAFCGSNIKYIKMTNKIEAIGRNAFLDCSELTTIYYEGTIEQWHAIVKDPTWDERTGDYVVICSDGILTKEQAHGSKTTISDQ